MNKKSMVVAGIAFFTISSSAFADQSDEGYRHDRTGATYRVEFHNLTDAQWFSPILCVLHNRRLIMFKDGQAATTGQATFSEDGFNGILAAELRENPLVYSVLQSEPGLTPPDSYRVEHITGPKRARLTCAAMPVTTNDVLTVVHNVKTPKHTGDTKNYYSTEWDLGSEENNYSAESMPEDSLNLVAESADNPVTISDNVVFGATGRPIGVPSLLSPFTRAFFNGNVIAEGTMSVFTHYEGSEAFPTQLYGWNDSASRLSVTRID